MKHLIFALALTLFITPAHLIACAILTGDYKIEGVKEGISQGHEKHPDAKHCGKFKMTEKEIRKFFAKSKDITPREKHDKYDWNPCQVTGTIVNGKEKADFIIYGSKIAELKYPDGKKQWLGCKECGKPFFEF